MGAILTLSGGSASYEGRWLSQDAEPRTPTAPPSPPAPGNSNDSGTDDAGRSPAIEQEYWDPKTGNSETCSFQTHITPQNCTTVEDLINGWILGNAPKVNQFGPSDPLTLYLRTTDHVSGVVDKIRASLTSGGGLEQNYPYYPGGPGDAAADLASYLSGGLFGGNDLESVLGGYDIAPSALTFTSTNTAVVTLTATNQMTIASATRMPGTGYGENQTIPLLQPLLLGMNGLYGGFADTTQIFVWQEEIHFRCADCSLGCS